MKSGNVSYFVQMMVKETTGQVSAAATDDSFEETVGAPASSGPGTQHQSHEEVCIILSA